MMTVHLACEADRVRHAITLSRTLALLSGDGTPAHRARCLIAGAQPHPSGGDGYTETLSLSLRELAKRKEHVKVAVVITDGKPNDPRAVREGILSIRRGGVIVIGLGLDLTKEEAAGVEAIFGKKDCVVVRIGDTSGPSFAALLGVVITAAVTRGVRLAIRQQ